MSEIQNNLEAGSVEGAENTSVVEAAVDHVAAASLNDSAATSSAETVTVPEPAAVSTAVAEAPTAISENEAQLKNALKGILNVDAEDFGEMVEHCSHQELSMLMEELAHQAITRENVRKVGKLKKRFDSLYQHIIKDLKEKPVDDMDAQALREASSLSSKRFQQGLILFNKNKNDFENDEQKRKEENTVKKRALLDKLKDIVMKEEVGAIETVQKIQEEWRSIGQVLQADVENLFQTYRAYLDQFYGMRAKHNEMLEQSRKVNYQQKEALIAEIINLTPSPDQQGEARKGFWQDAGERVKQIHDQWKSIGPVPKAQSDEIWQRFKDITDKFYKAKREFFDQLDEARKQNIALKQAVLDKTKTFITEVTATTLEEWKTASDQMHEFFVEWRNIGAAPQEANNRLNEEFNALRDQFNNTRSQYFKELDENRGDLAKKYETIVEEAEQIKDSDDWVKTTDRLIELQKDWNAIGDDNFKDGRKLKRRFRKACDHFFKRKKQFINSIRQSEDENLKLKTAIVESIEAQVQTAKTAKENGEYFDLNLDQLVINKEQFEEIGRVPIKQKDLIQTRFHNAFTDFIALAIDDLAERERFAMSHRFSYFRSSSRGGGPSFGSRQRDNAGGSSSAPANDANKNQFLEREERQYVKKIRSLEEKISQYENNFLFISQSKTSDTLRNDIETKMKSARELKERLELRLKSLRELKKNEKATAKEQAAAIAALALPDDIDDNDD